MPPLYYGDSLARKLKSEIVQSVLANARVPAMLASAPVAVFGVLLGLGGNLTAIVRART